MCRILSELSEMLMLQMARHEYAQYRIDYALYSISNNVSVLYQ